MIVAHALALLTHETKMLLQGRQDGGELFAIDRREFLCPFLQNAFAGAVHLFAQEGHLLALLFGLCLLATLLSLAYLHKLLMMPLFVS